VIPTTPIETTPIDDELDDTTLDETNPTISSPLKYVVLFLFFMIIPVGAWVYFYGGGKERIRRMRNVKGKGYERVEMD